MMISRQMNILLYVLLMVSGLIAFNKMGYTLHQPSFQLALIFWLIASLLNSFTIKD